MKKILLSVLAASALISASAQQRLVLYEEFSGENCGPCAAANPTLNATMAANTSKTILLKYQSPIPSAGPIYYENVTDVNARLQYYNVPFAPYGRNDGNELPDQNNPGHVSLYTQAAVNASYAVPTSFNMSATHAWSTDGSNVTFTVNVTSVTPFTGGNMKLRVALVEHLQFTTPPGTNGETDFHNVMRKMYPDATGTTVPNTWTAMQTATYTVTGTVPDYIDKTGEVFAIVWLQDDANKVVAQTTVSTPITINLDAASTGITTPSSTVCATTSTPVTGTVTIKNTGASTPLTSAAIYTKVDNGAWTLDQTWNGNLAVGATANVTLSPVTLTPGVHVIYDSVTAPNGMQDINAGNSKDGKAITVISTAPTTLPNTAGFETDTLNIQMPNNYILTDPNSNGQRMLQVWSGTVGTNIGHGNSTWVIWHNNFQYSAGESNLMIVPTPDNSAPQRAIDFWVAYAQYAAENDKLEVVWSDNCGQTWTPVWSQAGSVLKTHAPVGNNTMFVPTSASDWKQKSADISSVPAGAIVAFRATSDYGNSLFIDDVNIRTGAPLGVKEVAQMAADLNLFPNPATDKAVLSFNLESASNVKVQVVDAVGRVVANVTNTNMAKGQRTVDISTANLAAGVYNVMVQTEAGVATQRLTVVK